MPQRLPFAHDLPAQRYTVALDGAQYEVRLVWRARTASWYLDLADADGRWLVRGRRLSPAWSPHAGLITDGPPGILFVAAGTDPYARDEIELWYLTAEERAAVPPLQAASSLPVELA